MTQSGLEYTIVSDGQVWVDAGGPFGLVPRGLYETYLKPDEFNRVPMVLNCLLLRSEGKTIMIDTGLGNKLTPVEKERWNLDRTDGGLVENLAEQGVGVNDVDIVINTHLHTDHCGGNTVVEDGSLAAAFPNAEYWVQRIEWARAYHPDARTRGTYFSDNFVPLQEDGRLRLLFGDTSVTKHVDCVLTPGHTRGHQSVKMESESWRGLFVADMASYGIQMAKTAWLTAYDVLPLENIRTKRKWQKWALENQAKLFFEHDPAMKIAQLVEEAGRLELKIVEP
ncbi:MAG: MBL fold metallo-hydrolase [Anaerolineales bacterium]|jgi:glyoxylase-like metal-dependent hydrolase (beta-lactamase superfamily II)